MMLHQAQRFGLYLQETEPVSAFKSENMSQHEDRVALFYGTFVSVVRTLWSA